MRLYVTLPLNFMTTHGLILGSFALILLLILQHHRHILSFSALMFLRTISLYNHLVLSISA